MLYMQHGKRTLISGEPIIAKGIQIRLLIHLISVVDSVNVNDPGLVYDMGESDYVFNYLYTSAISRITNRFSRKISVTNVGLVNSQYKAIIEPPLGITIHVMPETLIFNSSDARKIRNEHLYCTLLLY
uniref:Subtilisin-like protease fibronectin type-III domain-containing protein n=1 Tax=Solanum lycopersicum TaxID=4081 RepID=A0A3Q7FK77_SOLLC